MSDMGQLAARCRVSSHPDEGMEGWGRDLIIDPPKRVLVEFRILGSVELWTDGRRYDLGTLKERCVLAVLLLAPGQHVSADKLVNRVWDEDPPPKARDNLYTYVSRLRTRLLRISSDVRINSSRSGGYVLEVDRERIDLHRFRLLRDQARAIADSGDADHALSLHRQAAQLWRAEPLAGLPGDWVARVRKNLEDELLAATFDRIKVELRMGYHADLVGELSELVAQHPFIEKLVEYLIVALYRCGRQADALQVYHEASHRLHEELGTGVTPDLHELHQRVLRRDRTLLLEPRSQPNDTQTPSNLPADLRFFTGRDKEIGELLAALSPARTSGPQQKPSATTVAIDGMAGIGKTVFAIHLAHRLADHYTDGRLYLDLHANDADQPATDPSTALDMLLRMLGIPASRIPRSLDDRAALWRAELSHRRVLLLLDDAAGHDQIRPLLSGAPDCLTFITSRRRLVGLDDVRSYSLDVLSPAAAATLFARVVGPDRPMNADDVAAVVRLCGYLPMAVQLVGNRLRHRPTWSVADLANRLAQDNHRLAEIRAENREISAAFAGSYDGLTAPLQNAFRRLGLHLGSDFSRHAAAAATANGSTEVQRILDDLLENHLITEQSQDRFRFHDLVRDYARHLAERVDSEAERRQTIQRILEYYLSNADRADRLLDPHRRRMNLDLTGSPPDPLPIETPQQAQEWMKAEHDNLLRAAHHAINHDWSRHAALFAFVLGRHLETGGHWEQAAYLHGHAINSWRQIGDQAGAAQALSDLSLVRLRFGQYGDALEHAEEALAIYQSVTDRYGEAFVLDHTGVIYWHQSEFEPALSSCRKALKIWRSIGDRHGEAHSLDHAAIYLDFLGRYHEAVKERERALALYAEIGDPHGQQMALNNMGDLHLRLGQVDAALGFYERAAAVTSEMSRQHQAIWLCNMANIHQHKGRYSEALESYRKALPINREIGDHSSEIDTLSGIGSTFQRMGHYGEALIHQQKSLAISRQISERHQEARALRCIGDSLIHFDRQAALDSYQEALNLTQQIGDLYEQAKALEGIGVVLFQTETRAQARRRFKQALRLYERLGVPEANSVRSYLTDQSNARS